MRLPRSSFALLAAVLVCSAPAPAASWTSIVYVEYDPAAPLDVNRSYGCLADPEQDATTGAPRTAVCERVPLADLCGTTTDGDLTPDCPFLPGAAPAPNESEVAAFADAVSGYFAGHLPKLSYTMLGMSAGPRQAWEMNMQPPPPGTSPSVGAWNVATPAERNALPTALEIDDPSIEDSRYGNAAWNNPYATPAEWNARMAEATLDHIYVASRNTLATPQIPNPPTTAVVSRATDEVSECRELALAALRGDVESHIMRAAGGTAPRPSTALLLNCLADPGPPVTPPPPPHAAAAGPPPPPPPPPPSFDGLRRNRARDARPQADAVRLHSVAASVHRR